MPELETVFFVHVPKTAGTSFRQALEQVFPGRLAFDYGAASPDTTDWVRRHVHEVPDREQFRRALQEREIAVFGGHVGRPHYGDVFLPERTIAFIREPVMRVVSEWHHHRRWMGLTQSLEEFAERPDVRNTHSRLLRGAPLERYGIVGMTSRYRESLDLVRLRFGWDVPPLVLNRNPERVESGGEYELPETIAARLAELNDDDVRLYGAAAALFENRAREMTSRRLAAPIRGHLDGIEHGHVYGWACRIHDATPLSVHVLVDDVEVAVVTADQPREDLRRKGIHPTGRAGFRVDIGRVTHGCIVRCIAEPGSFELSGRRSPSPEPDPAS